MPIRTLLASAATALALLSSPLAAQPVPFPPAPVPGQPDTRPVTTAGTILFALPAAVASADADPAIWVVRDADTTVYLFGTIHLLKPGLDWFNGPVKAAYDASDELVIEMVEPDAAVTQAATLKLGVDPSGTKLRDKLTPDARTAYEAALTALGVPVTGFDQFRPWLAGITLSVLPLIKAGFDPSAGVERAILAGNTKPVQGLETFEEQLGFFAGLSEADQIAFLNSTVDSLDGYQDEIDELVDAWSKGDVDRVAGLMNEGMDDSTPAVEKVLLTDRNVRWADWIAKRMAVPGTVFLAVGAGHLAGPNSVQAQLASRRLTATRIAD